MSETGIAPTRGNENEKICGDDGGAASCADADIGKRRHGFHFRTAPAGRSYGAVDKDL